MTHEQRAKSIAQLVKFHENLIKSNSMFIHIIEIIIRNIFLILATIDKLQRTTSLPNFNNKPTKLHSVTSLVSERKITNITHMENQTSSKSPTVENHIDENMNSEHIKLEISSDKRTTDLNTEITPAFIDQKIHTPVHSSELPDDQTISSPVKLVSLSGLDSLVERRLSEENKPIIHASDPSAITSVISSSIVHPPMIKPSPSERECIFISFFLTSSIDSIY